MDQKCTDECFICGGRGYINAAVLAEAEENALRDPDGEFLIDCPAETARQLVTIRAERDAATLVERHGHCPHDPAVPPDTCFECVDWTAQNWYDCWLELSNRYARTWNRLATANAKRDAADLTIAALREALGFIAKSQLLNDSATLQQVAQEAFIDPSPAVAGLEARLAEAAGLAAALRLMKSGLHELSLVRHGFCGHIEFEMRDCENNLCREYDAMEENTEALLANLSSAVKVASKKLLAESRTAIRRHPPFELEKERRT